MKSLLKPRYLLWLILGLPALAVLFKFVEDTSNAHRLLHPTGEFSARLMIIAMIATPLRLMFKTHRWPLLLVKSRRYFGVAAFGYALLHTILYVIDMSSIQLMLDELWALGIWTGWAAFLIFVPLAITSNDKSQRTMGIRWKQLQRWVYLAAVLTLVHWIFVHNHYKPALMHFLPLAALEAYRIYVQRTNRSS